MNTENLTKHQKEVLQRLDFDNRTFQVVVDNTTKEEEVFCIFPYKRPLLNKRPNMKIEKIIIRMKNDDVIHYCYKYDEEILKEYYKIDDLRGLILNTGLKEIYDDIQSKKEGTVTLNCDKDLKLYHLFKNEERISTYKMLISEIKDIKYEENQQNRRL